MCLDLSLNPSPDSNKQIEAHRMAKCNFHLWVYLFTRILYLVRVMCVLLSQERDCLKLTSRCIPRNVTPPFNQSVYSLINCKSLEHGWLLTFKFNLWICPGWMVRDWLDADSWEVHWLVNVVTGTFIETHLGRPKTWLVDGRKPHIVGSWGGKSI